MEPGCQTKHGGLARMMHPPDNRAGVRCDTSTIEPRLQRMRAPDVPWQIDWRMRALCLFRCARGCQRISE